MKNMSPMVAVLALALGGCSQKAMLDAFERMIPKEESTQAKTVLASLQKRDISSVKIFIHPDQTTPDLDQKLQSLSAIFPSGEPLQAKVVGANTFIINETKTTNLTLQYEYPGPIWILANVVIQSVGNKWAVTGLNAQSIPTSLEESSRFTFKEKTPLHFVMLILAGAVAVFVLFSLVVCIRTPVPKKKWLWIIFVLFGVGQFIIDWGSGQFRFNPLGFQLFGFGASKAGPYAPWFITVSLPIGAIVFLFKRKKWLNVA
jgi:hypothetical protein